MSVYVQLGCTLCMCAWCRYLDCSVQQCECPAPCHIGGRACSDATTLPSHVAQHISNGSIHMAHETENGVVTGVDVGGNEAWLHSSTGLPHGI